MRLAGIECVFRGVWLGVGKYVPASDAAKAAVYEARANLSADESEDDKLDSEDRRERGR